MMKKFPYRRKKNIYSFKSQSILIFLIKTQIFVRKTFSVVLNILSRNGFFFFAIKYEFFVYYNHIRQLFVACDAKSV